jgi:hypothetical protein
LVGFAAYLEACGVVFGQFPPLFDVI